MILVLHLLFVCTSLQLGLAIADTACRSIPGRKMSSRRPNRLACIGPKWWLRTILSWPHIWFPLQLSFIPALQLLLKKLSADTCFDLASFQRNGNTVQQHGDEMGLIYNERLEGESWRSL
jgi:hypothetical protein